MSEHPEGPSHITREDWDAVDVPEMTDAEFSRALPFKEAHTEAHAAWKRGLGKGYNARVESVLREALAKGKLDAPRGVAGDRKP